MFFYFSVSSIWIRSGRFSQSSTEYLPSPVNVLTLTPKISPNTMEDIFQINFPENDDKTWWKHSHWDVASIWDAFTCWLSKRVLKQPFLESGPSKSFTVSNFAKIHYLGRISFLSKCLKLYVDSRNEIKNPENDIRFPDKTIWIGSCKFSQSWPGYLSTAVNLLTNNPKMNLILGETFSKPISLRMMKKHDKSSLVNIWQVFGTLSHVDFQCVFWNDAI